MTVYVDTRWDGHRGITRYAREVTSRLATPHAAWTNRMRPTSVLDALSPARARLRGDDVLYTPGFSAGLARCRQLVTLHDLIHLGSHDPKARLHQTYYDRVVRPAIRRTGHVMTVSEASRATIAEWLRDDRVAIHVTGEGTSPTFTPDGPAARYARPYLLYVGNMRAHKNPALFFAALSRLPEHLAVVVTSDPKEAGAYAADHGVAERTSVLTGIDDDHLAQLYRGAEALVFPSLEEGFGLPPLEALRCGCPVVYYAGCAAVAEVVGADAAGAVGSATDVAAWAEILRDPPAVSVELAERAASFTWDAAARAVDDCLARL